MPKAAARGITVTKCWGFIVVDFVCELLVFSINAELIASYAHDCDFTYLAAISSPDDFDYVVVADVKGNLLLLDAYQPAKRVTLAQLEFPVCFIDYERSGDWLVVVAPTGKLLLIVHPFAALTSSGDDV
jgi:hypothetical protein